MNIETARQAVNTLLVQYDQQQTRINSLGKEVARKNNELAQVQKELKKEKDRTTQLTATVASHADTIAKLRKELDEAVGKLRRAAPAPSKPKPSPYDKKGKPQGKPLTAAGAAAAMAAVANTK